MHRMRMSHGKVWLIEKEYDSFVKGSFVVDGVDRIPEREKKIVIGYNNLDHAKEFCETMNRECGNCPRRAALHTTYKVLPNFINVRYRYNEDSPPRS